MDNKWTDMAEGKYTWLTTEPMLIRRKEVYQMDKFFKMIDTFLKEEPEFTWYNSSYPIREGQATKPKHYLKLQFWQKNRRNGR